MATLFSRGVVFFIVHNSELMVSARSAFGYKRSEFQSFKFNQEQVLLDLILFVSLTDFR